MKETQAALDQLVSGKVMAQQPKTLPQQPGAPTYLKYKPLHSGPQHNSGAEHRIIKMQDMPIDPMEPPKFRHKKVHPLSDEPHVSLSWLPSTPSQGCSPRLACVASLDACPSPVCCCACRGCLTCVDVYLIQAVSWRWLMSVCHHAGATLDRVAAGARDALPAPGSERQGAAGLEDPALHQ